MPREAGNALQQGRAPEGPGSPWQQQQTLQIPGKGDVFCGSLWDMDWGKLATANIPGLGNESGIIIKGPILGSSKPLLKHLIDNSRTVGLGFRLITEGFLNP